MIKALKKLVPVPFKRWYHDTRYYTRIRWRTFLHDDCSQAGEITAIRKLIKPDWPTWLVDVGANDGRTISNTFPFVRDGWTGLLLEPQPQVFARLQATHLGRANALCREMAAGEVAGTATMYISDLDSEGLGSTINTDEIGLMRERREGTRTIEIAIKTLSELLAEHQFPADFSLLSVDAEGCDLEVLRGLDCSRFRPRLILTEQFRIHTTRERAKLDWLEGNGYKLHLEIGCNEIWGLPRFLAPVR